MFKKLFVPAALFMLFAISSCSKKGHPETNTTTTTAPVAKPAKKPVVKTAVPKVITVNDQVAKRSVDGRHYYDLEGRRYWKNYKDGKYYLFHKSMFDDPDFKSRGN